jgi:ketosteroid isomerase-like protein
MLDPDQEGGMEEHADPMRQARCGLVAWQRGDLTALAELLDPDVELMWWTPGDWDCHGKAEVLALLTERVNAAPPAEVDINVVDESRVLVERRHAALDGPEAGLRPATRVRFRAGRVVQMQQYRSRDDALADIR